MRDLHGARLRCAYRGTSALSAIGGIASAVGDVALATAAGAAALAPSAAATVRLSGERLVQLYDAHGVRAAARSWPVAVPELAAESPGAQSAVPVALVDPTTGAQLTSDLGTLNPSAVATLRAKQRQMVGRAAAFSQAVREFSKAESYSGIVYGSQVSLWFALTVAVVGAVAAVVFSAVEMTYRGRYDQLDRELRSVDECIARMTRLCRRCGGCSSPASLPYAAKFGCPGLKKPPCTPRW